MAEQILGKNGIRAVAGPTASILSVVTDYLPDAETPLASGSWSTAPAALPVSAADFRTRLAQNKGPAIVNWGGARNLLHAGSRCWV